MIVFYLKKTILWMHLIAKTLCVVSQQLDFVTLAVKF